MVPVSKKVEEVNTEYNKFHCGEIELEVPVDHLREYIQWAIEDSRRKLGGETGARDKEWKGFKSTSIQRSNGNGLHHNVQQ